MKKTTLTLSNGIIVKGYSVGHFFVYKLIKYWHVAHQGGGRYLEDFARRKDAIVFIKAMDCKEFDYSYANSMTSEELSLFHKKYRAALEHCSGLTRFDNILRCPGPFANKRPSVWKAMKKHE